MMKNYKGTINISDVLYERIIEKEKIIQKTKEDIKPELYNIDIGKSIIELRITGHYSFNENGIYNPFLIKLDVFLFNSNRELLNSKTYTFRQIESLLNYLSINDEKSDSIYTIKLNWKPDDSVELNNFNKEALSNYILNSEDEVEMCYLAICNKNLLNDVDNTTLNYFKNKIDTFRKSLKGTSMKEKMALLLLNLINADDNPSNKTKAKFYYQRYINCVA